MRSIFRFIQGKILFWIFSIYFSTVCTSACRDPETIQPQHLNDSVKKVKDYIKIIPGKSDTISAEISDRGEVLIAYSDCYSCHTEDKRSKGPAFKDIAKRYPVNEGYIELLAHRIILGGSGAWGYPVMNPHPDLSLSDARIMVKYILSLKE